MLRKERDTGGKWIRKRNTRGENGRMCFCVRGSLEQPLRDEDPTKGQGPDTGRRKLRGWEFWLFCKGFIRKRGTRGVP